MLCEVFLQRLVTIQTNNVTFYSHEVLTGTCAHAQGTKLGLFDYKIKSCTIHCTTPEYSYLDLHRQPLILLLLNKFNNNSLRKIDRYDEHR